MSDSLLQSRVCTCCLIEKPDSEFHSHSWKLRGKDTTCKACRKLWRYKNRAKINAWCKRYRASPHGRRIHLESQSKYISSPHGRQKRREYEAKRRAELSRTYVIRNLIQHTALKTKDVPMPLIEAARASLKLKRHIWQNQRT